MRTTLRSLLRDDDLKAVLTLALFAALVALAVWLEHS